MLKYECNKILFICGFPSGGTDLLKNMLNAHPNINMCGEMPFLVNLTKYGYNQYSTFKNLDEIEKLRRILNKLDVWKNFQNIGYDFSDLVKNRRSITLSEIMWYLFSSKNAKIRGNKTPQYAENIDKLTKLSSNFLFLIIVRDVRDICLSMRKKWGRNIYRTAYNWNNRMKKCIYATSQIQEHKYLFLRYEDLIDDQQHEVKKIINFLNVKWSPRVLEFHKYIETITDGKINYGKPIIKNNKEKWKTQLAKDEIKRIEEISFDTLKRFNYPIQYAINEKTILKYNLKFFELKDLISLIFIGNRSSINNSFVTRVTNLFLEIKKRFGYY